MIDVPKIAILSTVINFELYSKSAHYFPKNIQKYIIDGRNGMHGIDSLIYMMKKLKDKDIDWLILADEDVFFLDSDSVFEIIEEMKINEFLFCGVRDGGVVSHRNYNPLVPNTFFSILNFKEIKKIWNQKVMLSNQYLIKNEFKDDLKNLPYKFDTQSLYEPYYCFYLWLRRKNKNVLFLEAEMPFSNDTISNSVLNLKGVPMLYHSWYARSFGINKIHTARIETILNKIKTPSFEFKDVIIFKDDTFALRSKFKKMIRRLKNKLQKN